MRRSLATRSLTMGLIGQAVQPARPSAVGVSPGGEVDSGPDKPQNIVKGINDMFIRPKNPEAVVDFLNNKLGLPVNWPLEDYSRELGPGVGSAGLYAGNINLEIVRGGPPSFEGGGI